MISIVTVAWNAYDFVDLLIESIERFSELQNEIIVVDNSNYRKEINKPHVHQFFMTNNIGHGRGLNYGAAKALELFPKNPFIMFLDSDCHFLCHNWETPFIAKMRNHLLIGGKGTPTKPIRPACMFFHRKAAHYDWSDTKGYAGVRKTPKGYDVACKAYYQMMADNQPIAFLESKKNRYGTNNGEEYAIEGKPLVYHHWHGSHLTERQIDFPNVDLQKDKDLLFSKIPWRLP